MRGAIRAKQLCFGFLVVSGSDSAHQFGILRFGGHPLRFYV
jgi:hypothetical protein